MQQAVRVTTSCATPLRVTRRCPAKARVIPCRRAVVVRASKDDDKDDFIAGAVKAAGKLVDKATDFVPESVPRPTAKAGVAIASVMFTFWLLQKVISSVVTLALFAGVAYYVITQQQGDKDDVIDVTSSSSSNKGGKGGKGSKPVDDLDDPLAEARRIMDKYK